MEIKLGDFGLAAKLEFDGELKRYKALVAFFIEQSAEHLII